MTSKQISSILMVKLGSLVFEWILKHTSSILILRIREICLWQEPLVLILKFFQSVFLRNRVGCGFKIPLKFNIMSTILATIELSRGQDMVTFDLKVCTSLERRSEALPTIVFITRINGLHLIVFLNFTLAWHKCCKVIISLTFQVSSKKLVDAFHFILLVLLI